MFLSNRHGPKYGDVDNIEGRSSRIFGKLSRCEVRSFCQSRPDPCTAPLSQRGGPKYGAFDTDSDGAAKKVADRHGPKYAKVVTTPGFRSVQMVATRACGAACATREPACRAPGSGRSPAAGPAWRRRRSLRRLDGTCAAAAWSRCGGGLRGGNTGQTHEGLRSYRWGLSG